MMRTAYDSATNQLQQKRRWSFLPVLFTFLLVLGCVAQGFSQAINLSEKNASLESVFRKIKQKSGYTFVYRDEWMKAAKPVTVELKNATIQQALDACFANQPLTYTLVQKTVVIKQKTAAEQGATPANNLTDITGVVVNEAGEPLGNTTVRVNETGQVAIADKNGNFSLKQVPRSASLQASFVGYDATSIPLNGNSSVRIQLKATESILNETVVIGYGTTTKRRNTGSVASITADEIGKQPVSNPLAALSGRLAGTSVAQNNGLPGSAVQIQIRGQNTLSSGGIPLYIIDGVPFTNFNGGSPATDNLNAFGTSGANGGVSPFGMINPADIERIDILKDADATAIYGSRGTNGVVLITTKKGKAGKTRLDVNVSSGLTEVGRFIPVLNLQQYLQLRREAFANDRVTPTVANAPDLLVWDTTKATDWQKLLLGGTGHITDAQASLSGGEGRTRFFFNAAYRKESTVFPGDFADRRLSTRLNVDHTSANGRFNASFSASYSNSNTNLPTADLASNYNLPPNLPLYDSTGKLFWNASFTNPLSNLLRKYSGVTSNLIGNTTLRYRIINGLNVKLNLGYTTTDLNQKTASPASSLNPANNPTSSAIFADNKAENWIVEPTVEYVRNVSAGKLSVLGGASWQHNTSEGYYLSGTNYTNEALLGTLIGAGLVTASYNNIVQYKYAAAFGRVNYDWQGKYIINGTFRRDGSSRFGPNNRFGNFGAVGAAWVFSEESFIKNSLPFLSYGKLRGSYGTTGNDQIGNYIYLPLYTSTTAYQGTPAIYPQTLPNANVQWETTRKAEIGLDLGFWKDRIVVTASYYRNRSNNLISSVAVPTQSGYNSQTVNFPALVQNTGLELELNTTNVKLKNFQWNTTLNMTFPANKLVDFPGLASSFYSGSYVVGQPINLTRIYNYTGVNPTTGAATYEDLNKDGNIAFANDRVIAPRITEFYGGFGNTFTYKGWQLEAFFQFNHRSGVTNVLTTPVGTLRNQNTSVLDRWTPTNTTANFPGTSATSGSTIANAYSFYASSSANWGNASYLKLRSINLYYTLPAKWISPARITNCRLFVQAQNVFTWAKNRYIYDTETTIQGGPSGLGTGTIGQVLPPLRTILFGINCSF